MPLIYRILILFCVFIKPLFSFVDIEGDEYPLKAEKYPFLVNIEKVLERSSVDIHDEVGQYCVGFINILRKEKLQNADFTSEAIHSYGSGYNPLAKFLYAFILANGIGVKQNSKRAVCLYEGSVRQDFPLAQYMMGGIKNVWRTRS